MTDEPVDLRRLADEAAREVYDPRAKRCFVFRHEWTMWKADPTGRRQTRRCLRCGKAAMLVMAKECAHLWDTHQKYEVFDEMESEKRPIGVSYMQHCTRCGEVRRKNLLSTYT